MLDSEPWRGGDDATEALQRLVAGRKVACQQKDRIQYGRIVAMCYAGGDDLSAAMVREG